MTRLPLIALALALGACSAMPVKDGPRARMMDGISEPRDRAEMEITEVARPWFWQAKCAEWAALYGHEALAVWAAISNLLPDGNSGCAFTPNDKMAARLKANGEPLWCKIAYPSWCPICREHETRHCEGWDHPAAEKEDHAR